MDSDLHTSAVEAKLAELGITLPTPMAPVANYVPFVVTGALVVVSGQIPAVDGVVAVTGTVGEAVTIEQGQQAARLCFINVLAQLQVACGGASSIGSSRLVSGSPSGTSQRPR